MDQKKTGQFLKTLRKEKSITQETLAEALNVSSRTVSRWETGSNMPDISLLVELSEFYQVSLLFQIISQFHNFNKFPDLVMKNLMVKISLNTKHYFIRSFRKIQER